jgi:AcrR family transcriptional regulator
VIKTTSDLENIKELIHGAVDRLLARDGYKKMTVEDLAREV